MEPELGKLVSRAARTVRPTNDIHPGFYFKFNETLHGEEFKKRFKFPHHLDTPIQQRLVALINKYWCVFIKKNVPIPIRDYEFHIDTVSATPVIAKNPCFGLHETPTMQKTIDALLDNNQIVPDTEYEWLRRPVLAP